MTYKNCKELFLMYIKSYCAEPTQEYYKLNLGLFERFILDIGKTLDDDINTFTKNHYIGYLCACREKGVKNTSVRTYIRAIKVFFRYCYNEGHMIDNITKNVKQPKSDKRQIVPLTTSRVEKIYSSMLGSRCELRNRAIFSLMLDCGLRLGEVVALDKNCIDYDNDCIQILNTKNNKSRIVPLPLSVKQNIKKYLATREDVHNALFLDVNGCGRVTEKGIQVFMHRLKKVDSGVHCHLLRHTFATSFMMGGGQLEILRVLLGHDEYIVTKDYIHLASQLGVINYDIYRLDGVMFSRYIAYTPSTATY